MASQLLTIPALLKGPKDSKMLSMIIDSGATTTIIPRELALAIGCNLEEVEEPALIITASGLEFFRLVRIPELICLGCVVRNFEAACHPLPSLLQAGGLLGMDFLRQFPPFQDFEAAVRSSRDRG